MAEKVRQTVEGSDNIQISGDVQLNVYKGKTPKNFNRIVDGILKPLYIILIISLICTVLPHSLTNKAASITTVFCFLLIFPLNILRSSSTQSPQKNNRFKYVISCMLVVSMISGCAGAIREDIAIPESIPKNERRIGISEEIGIFGFGLDKVNIETAKNNGGITDIRYVESVRSYGLISFAKMRVVGF